MDLQKIEHRSVMKFLTKENKSPKEIFERMQVVYGDQGPSYNQVKYWCKQFKWGRESVEDDPRPGRPSDATNEEMCRKVEKMVMEDRRLKVSQIAHEMGISEPSVLDILHNKLGMSKVSSRWVPRMLTAIQKETRMDLSRENLEVLNEDPDLFTARVVTGDETWIHHWDPETKQESMQWKHHGSPPPRKFKTQASAGKIMGTFFWDSEGLLLADYMPHKTTITADVYAEQIRKLRAAIVEKRRGKISKGVLLLHDNAPVHTARKSKAAIRECGFEEIPHPPYSPDLAPSDYYLFRHLKKHLRGRRFSSDDEVKSCVQQWFEGQEPNFFSEGISSLKSKWEKCVDIRGDYIEK